MMLDIVRSLVFAMIFGVMENRFFFEAGDAIILNHFRLYHVFLGILYATVSFSLSPLDWLIGFLVILLLEDVVWWAIEVSVHGRKPSKEDWDNYGHFNLVLGVFWWWWVLLGLIEVLLGVRSVIA